MDTIDWKIVAEIFSPLVPQLQWPTLTTLLLLGVLDYYGHTKRLKEMHFLFLPSAVGAWVAGFVLVFTNFDLLCLWVIVMWWFCEKALKESTAAVVS